ncbi:uncharacterized protein LOC111404581 [Olea europaea var. sylvestris]|uniref:uncharacterized protein LOC111404581 n=1 Tax=Olea europaea var. sylvestris TaxID=158386 RepID=UPI000C1D7A0D|nr:uncharacterized protein LOC111404581 [Olea europaea var. sylvestris]
MEHDKVFAYSSRQLKLYEQSYPKHNLELAAAIHVLKIWRHYVYGGKFDIYTDHKSLKSISYVDYARPLWREFKRLNLEVVTQPGVVTRVAALSIHLILHNVIKGHQMDDQSFEYIKSDINSEKWNDFTIVKDEALYYQEWICQVNAEHHRPSGLLELLEVVEWKLEHVTIDFVIGYSRVCPEYLVYQQVKAGH